MSLEQTELDIALRLTATLVGCGALGLDRGQRGRTAGLRTTMLVGLAAAVAMVQMNLLTPLAAASSASAPPQLCWDLQPRGV